MIAVWDWLLPAYLGFLTLAGGAALAVALLVPEDQHDRRKTSFSILKLFYGAGTSLAAIATTTAHLTGSGLL